MRIDRDWGENLTQGGRHRRVEQEETHHDGLHALRAARVRDLVGGDVAEALGDGAEGDVGDLPPDAEWGDAGADAARGGVVAAGGGLVNAPLEDGADDAGDGGENEAEGDAADTAKFDVVPPQHWVEAVGQDRDADDDCEGVEIG